MFLLECGTVLTVWYCFIGVWICYHSLVLFYWSVELFSQSGIVCIGLWNCSHSLVLFSLECGTVLTVWYCFHGANTHLFSSLIYICSWVDIDQQPIDIICGTHTLNLIISGRGKFLVHKTILTQPCSMEVSLPIQGNEWSFISQLRVLICLFIRFFACCLEIFLPCHILELEDFPSVSYFGAWSFSYRVIFY